MNEVVIASSELRTQWAAALGAVEYAGQRIVIVHHGRVVGAVVSEKDLERLRRLAPEPVALTEHEKSWRRRDAMERHSTLLQTKARAQEALEEARGRKDELAIANAELELEEVTEAMASAMKQASAA